MSSACIREFLSHPIQCKKHSLINHLLDVAKESKNLFSQTKFINHDIAFYSGLLHDMGKLNSFYQDIFNEPQITREKKRKKSLENYVQRHSGFSAWIAHQLLKKSSLDYDTIDKIIVLIYGHHSKIRKDLGDIFEMDTSLNKEKFKKSQNSITKILPEFYSQVSAYPEFLKLNWDSCFEKFPRPVKFNVELNSQSSPDDYLEMSFAFSCLLQADRGSFEPWSVPNFDLDINTHSMKKQNSELAEIRTNFQDETMKNFDDSEPIVVINAPTGIGKTKVFLDIIKKYSESHINLERMFYFSPLLALTDDFEEKITNTISEFGPIKPVIPKQNDVLIYNHIFSGTLELKHSNKSYQHSQNNNWFETESFNKKFIITTTQRLLMIIYSNNQSNKMKLASFKNSVLIIDEVQTIPKPILANLKEIFRKMNQYMGTRFILVSATIPHEINDVKRVELSKDILNNYLEKTIKQISIKPEFDVQSISFNKTLVMLNTRRKAVNIFQQIKSKYPTKNIYYLSSGIKKETRKKIIESLSNKSDYVLVSTQVVEAGVDISFSRVFREEAPLDNIIQVMGRLNREGENKDARLVIFSTDNKSIPYSSLEFKITQEMIQGKTNSIQIYDLLQEYYSEISAQNKRNLHYTQKLNELIADVDFDNVWKHVKGLAFQDDDSDNIIIPDHDKWDTVKAELLCEYTNDDSKKFKTNKTKNFGEISASISLKKIGEEHFDEDLMMKNILLPKKESLEIVYDKTLGLDKWLME